MRFTPDGLLAVIAAEHGIYRIQLRHQLTRYEERKLTQLGNEMESLYQRIEKRIEKRSEHEDK